MVLDYENKPRGDISVILDSVKKPSNPSGVKSVHQKLKRSTDYRIRLSISAKHEEQETFDSNESESKSKDDPVLIIKNSSKHENLDSQKRSIVYFNDGL